MIQANELRVGNWVNTPHGYTYISHVKDLLDCRNYHPIPLTPEILEKAGFKIHPNSTKHWTHWWLTNGWLISQAHHTEKAAGVENDKFYYDIDNLKIGYLHQLQNLYFALTGEELIIEL